LPRLVLISSLFFDNSKAILDYSSQFAYELVAILNNTEESEVQWVDPSPVWVLPLKASLQK
jgi:hypothetical protein